MRDIPWDFERSDSIDSYIYKCEFCGWRSHNFMYLNTHACPESRYQLDYENYFFRAIARKLRTRLFKIPIQQAL
ncbi:hypothetical protein QUA44_27000 [Microcoleus sp. N9_A2]|uniref:hypothetical protein n=1 Tax=unclassified Microcoleus TaxID=2642155 RepID=UPI002FD08367